MITLKEEELFPSLKIEDFESLFEKESANLNQNQNYNFVYDYSDETLKLIPVLELINNRFDHYLVIDYLVSSPSIYKTKEVFEFNLDENTVEVFKNFISKHRIISPNTKIDKKFIIENSREQLGLKYNSENDSLIYETSSSDGIISHPEYFLNIIFSKTQKKENNYSMKIALSSSVLTKGAYDQYYCDLSKYNNAVINSNEQELHQLFIGKFLNIHNVDYYTLIHLTYLVSESHFKEHWLNRFLSEELKPYLIKYLANNPDYNYNLFEIIRKHNDSVNIIRSAALQVNDFSMLISIIELFQYVNTSLLNKEDEANLIIELVNDFVSKKYIDSFSVEFANELEALEDYCIELGIECILNSEKFKTINYYINRSSIYLSKSEDVYNIITMYSSIYTDRDYKEDISKKIKSINESKKMFDSNVKYFSDLNKIENSLLHLKNNTKVDQSLISIINDRVLFLRKKG